MLFFPGGAFWLGCQGTLFLAKTEVGAILDLGGPRAFGEMEPGWSTQGLRGRLQLRGVDGAWGLSSWQGRKVRLTLACLQDADP